MSQEELEEYKQQLQTVEEGLIDDPDNESFKDLKKELIDLIKLLQEALGNDSEDIQNVNKDNQQTHEVTSREESVDINPSITPEPSATSTNHDNQILDKASSQQQAPKPLSPPPPPPPPPSSQTPKFTIGNIVLAKYISGDRKFYRSKITSITGSKENPIYTIKFLNQQYANVVETVGHENIREINQNQSFGGNSKNTNSGTSARQTPPPPPSSNLTSNSLPQKRPRDQNQPAKSQPVSKAKLLDQQKNKWQQFSKKINKTSKSKKLGEDSMFRTSDDPTARVGVIRGVKSSKPSRPSKNVFDTSSRVD